MIIFLIISGFTDAKSHANPLSEDGYKARAAYVSDQLIKNRLENLSSVIEINYTPEVGRRIREYTVNYRVAGERILGRVDLFFPMFEEEIDKRNLPDELKYIAVVESNLDPTAYSNAGAVGLWQFIKSTGRMKGLKIDNYIDERKDPQKSTEAALEYLIDLYDEFDDWTLAMAAYNCGPGNVRKAIRRGKSRDFWEIRRFLPNETQKYVPRIIAAMYLMQYYHAHELVPENVNEDMRNIVTIKDGRSHNFSKLSKDLEIPFKMLKSLNPQYKTNYFPKNTGQLNLVIPASKYDLYLSTYDEEAYKDLLAQRHRAKILKRKQERVKKIMETRLEYPEQLMSIIYKDLNAENWVREINTDALVLARG